MDDYLQKYLDGTLSDEEAAAFNDSLARDPSLDAELREYERILALMGSTVPQEPPAHFTDEVMGRVTATAISPDASWAAAAQEDDRGFVRRHMTGLRYWGRRLAWTAAFAGVFLIGYLVAQTGDRTLPGRELSAGAPGETEVTDAGNIEPAAATLRLVRLVYVPQNHDVGNVAVAGTFNGWDPSATTMDRKGEVWMVQMVLPPGSYEYMFIEDGQRWVTDPLATVTRDDGFGQENAVLDVTM